MHNITNNATNQRFEVLLPDGEYAYLEYRYYKKDIAFMHTFVPENHEGQGLAAALAVYAFNFAKNHKLPVMVYCPYVAGFLKRHPEYKEQLDKQYLG
jgi:predicted GNAT family acetyltransferase